jgi:hypothetical protein
MRIFFLLAAVLLSATHTLAAEGLEPGEPVTGYQPKHVSGEHKGTRECPPCKYGKGPLIQMFIHGETLENTQAFSTKLDAALKANEKLRGFVIVTDEQLKLEMEKWAAEWKLEKVALCYLPFSIKSTTLREYNISAAKNVIVVSNAKKVIQSFENAKPDDLERTLNLLK